jgi:hypothetical protein
MPRKRPVAFEIVLLVLFYALSVIAVMQPTPALDLLLVLCILAIVFVCSYACTVVRRSRHVCNVRTVPEGRVVGYRKRSG